MLYREGCSLVEAKWRLSASWSQCRLDVSIRLTGLEERSIENKTIDKLVHPGTTAFGDGERTMRCSVCPVKERRISDYASSLVDDRLATVQM